MKKAIMTLLIAVAIVACSTYKSASGNKPYRPLKSFNLDTMAYLKYNFEERKAAYIGKPLSELLKDCELPVKSFLSGANGEIIQVDMTTLFFEPERISSYRAYQGQDDPRINIDWRTPLSEFERARLYRLYGSDWSVPQNRAFHESAIIGDIDVRGKNFSELPPLPNFEPETPSPTLIGVGK
jgi:hypothetical protein